MMRGLAVAGPRPSQGVAAQIKNADIEDISQLGVELLARPAPGLDQRQLTHRNPDLRVTSIDQRGAPIPAVRETEIERQGSTQSGHLRALENRQVWVLSILSIPGAKRARLAAVSNKFSPRTAVLEMTRQNSLAFLIANIEKLFFRVHLARESASNDSAVDWPASGPKT